MRDIKAWLDDYFRNTHLGNPQPIHYQFVNMNNESSPPRSTLNDS